MNKWVERAFTAFLWLSCLFLIGTVHIGSTEYGLNAAGLTILMILLNSCLTAGAAWSLHQLKPELFKDGEPR